MPDVAKTVEQLGDLDALEEQLSRVRDIANDILKAVGQLDDLDDLQRNLSSISNLAETDGLGDLDDLQIDLAPRRRMPRSDPSICRVALLPGSMKRRASAIGARTGRSQDTWAHAGTALRLGDEREKVSSLVPSHGGARVHRAGRVRRKDDPDGR